MTDAADYDTFIDYITKDLDDDDQEEMFRNIWDRIKAEPEIETPGLSLQEDDCPLHVKISWSKQDNYFEIDVHEDGLCEWFLSATESDGSRTVDGNEDPEALDVESIIETAKKYFARVS